MSTISKTTFTFTVLHRSDEPFLSDDPLHEAMERSMHGNAVGWETGSETVEVPDTEVPEELVELGNDGNFFDIDLGIGTETYMVFIEEEI